MTRVEIDSADERATDGGAWAFATPSGDPCPRQLRADGSVEGSGHCYGCGSCLLLELAAWPLALPANPIPG